MGVFLINSTHDFFFLMQETEGNSFFSIDDNAGIRVMIAEKKRPKIPSSWPLGLANLIKDCWAHFPSDRPKMEEVKLKSTTINMQYKN